MARAHVRYIVTDRAGNAIQNAKVTFYLTGTSNLVTDLYSVATGGSPVTSASFISNNQGEVEAWMATPKTIDAQVADNSHAAYYSGAVGTLLSWNAFIETIEVLPPPENIGTLDGTQGWTGSNSFSSVPLVQLSDPAVWIDVRAYGAAASAAAATNDSAIASAISRLGSAGGTVFFGAIFPTSATVTGTANIVLRGTGSRTGGVSYSGTSYAIQLGNATYGSPLAYGCAIEDFKILLTGNSSKGITLRETAQAALTNLYIEGPVGRTITDAAITSGSTTVTSATAAFTAADVGRQLTGPAGIAAGTTISSVTNATTAVMSAAATATASAQTMSISANSIGVYVDGGNTSNLFTTMTNVVCNHVFYGYLIDTGGTTTPTTVTGVGCTAFCDQVIGSNGIRLVTSQSAVWLGGNLENCDNGVIFGGPNAFDNRLIAVRFEANRTWDVYFNTGCKGNSVVEAHDLAPGKVSDQSGNRTNRLTGSDASGNRVQSLNSSVYVPLAAPANKLAIGPDSTLNGQNNVWQTVDISALVPLGATAVVLFVMTRDTINGTSATIYMRGNGITTGGSAADGTAFRTSSATTYVGNHITVPLDAAQRFQYKPVGFAAAAGELYVDIQGYYA